MDVRLGRRNCWMDAFCYVMLCYVMCMCTMLLAM